MVPLLSLAAPTLERQQSLITRQQSLDLSGNRSSYERLVDQGIWERIDSGLYGPVGVPMTWRRWLMAAVLLAPEGSLVSHRAGAALQQVGGLVEPTPEISIPRGTTFRRPWLITHESCDLDLADRAVVDGIPVTGLCRLAMDLGSVVSFDRYKQTIREVRHGRQVRSEQLLSTYLRHKARGRNGGGALRDWLDRYYEIAGTPESGLEHLALDGILDAGLLAPAVQHWVEAGGRRYRLDLAYPSHMVCIEVDGIQHEDDEEKISDRARTRRLVAAGWTVIRIRSRFFATDLVAAIAKLRTLLL